MEHTDQALETTAETAAPRSARWCSAVVLVLAVGTAVTLLAAGSELPAWGPVLMLAVVAALSVNQFVLFPTEHAATAEAAVLLAAVVGFRDTAPYLGPVVLTLLVGPLDVLHWEQRSFVRMAYNTGNRGLATLAPGHDDVCSAAHGRERLHLRVGRRRPARVPGARGHRLRDLRGAAARTYGESLGAAVRHLLDVDVLTFPIACVGATAGLLAGDVGWWATTVVLLPTAYLPVLVINRGRPRSRSAISRVALTVVSTLAMVALITSVPATAVLATLCALTRWPPGSSWDSIAGSWSRRWSRWSSWPRPWSSTPTMCGSPPRWSQWSRPRHRGGVHARSGGCASWPRSAPHSGRRCSRGRRWSWSRAPSRRASQPVRSSPASSSRSPRSWSPAPDAAGRRRSSGACRSSRPSIAGAGTWAALHHKAWAAYAFVVLAALCVWVCWGAPAWRSRVVGTGRGAHLDRALVPVLVVTAIGAVAVAMVAVATTIAAPRSRLRGRPRRRERWRGDGRRRGSPVAMAPRPRAVGVVAIAVVSSALVMAGVPLGGADFGMGPRRARSGHGVVVAVARPRGPQPGDAHLGVGIPRSARWKSGEPDGAPRRAG